MTKHSAVQHEHSEFYNLLDGQEIEPLSKHFLSFSMRRVHFSSSVLQQGDILVHKNVKHLFMLNVRKTINMSIRYQMNYLEIQKFNPVLFSNERPIHQCKGGLQNFGYFLDSVPLHVFFYLPGYNLYHYHFLLKNQANSCLFFRWASLILGPSPVCLHSILVFS